jgi:hypothetical protein
MNRQGYFLSTAVLAGVLLVMIVTAPPALGQVASAQIREDEELPGAPGENIDSISNSAVNHVGGFAFTVNTSGSGTTLGHVWGNAAGGPGTVIRTEGTIGDLVQTSYESFFGISDAGLVGYSAISDRIGGSTSLDGAWLDDTVVLNEEDPVPTIPGQFSTFNSRVGITGDGKPYWVGGISTIQGGSTQNRVIFFDTTATPLLMGGDPIVGVAEPVGDIDFDLRATFVGGVPSYINQVLVESGSTTNDGVVVIDGAALFIDGAVTREASPVPAAAGGLPGENWDNFDFFGITPTGGYLVTGDTDAATTVDEFVMVDGVIVLREGDVLDLGGDAYTLSGSIEGAYLNDDGDWAVVWDANDPGGANIEVLILNGEIVLKEGDLVDWNGDGVIDAGDNGGVVTNFTGISALTLGDRDDTNQVTLCFTADIDFAGTVLEGGFLLTVPVGPVVGACGVGAVNAGCGTTADVLFVNDQTGGADRVVDEYDQVTPLSFTVIEPPALAGDGNPTPVCIYAWVGEPDATDVVAVPKGLGSMCFGPYVITTKLPTRIFNGIGVPNKLGEHNSPFPPPVIDDGTVLEFARRPNGTLQPVTATIQGIIPDPCSQGTAPYSVTNGLVLEVL